MKRAVAGISNLPHGLHIDRPIGEAHSLGWRVVARCAYSRTDGPSSKSSLECIYRKELDMETLVWTRGRTFLVSRLENRLRCPQCGLRQIVVNPVCLTSLSGHRFAAPLSAFLTALAEVAQAIYLFIEHALIIAFVSYAALAGTSTIEEASKDS